MKLNFKYRAPGAGSEGGSTENYSLSDLDNDDVQPDAPKGEEPKIPELDPSKGKPDPNEPKPETDEEREARETAEANEAEKQRLADEAKKKKDEPADDPDPDDKSTDETPDDAEEFFKDVNALRGDELDVDYGDVDPLTPEGIVLRDKAVEANAIEQFEAHLEATYPKAYAFLLHQVSGKPEEEFFGQAADLDVLPTAEQVEASVEVQKQIVIKDLLDKGNSEKHANLIIKQAIEDSELEEMAKDSLKNQSERQAAKLEAIKAENDKITNEKTQAITEMATFVDGVVNSGKIGNITIPEKERAEFAKVFKESVRYYNGTFQLVTNLSNDNLQEMFAKEYFAYKKGNLGTIVQAAAKTENVKRLKRTIPKTTTPQGGAQDKTKYVTLGEMDAD